MFIGAYSISVLFSYIGILLSFISCYYIVNNDIKIAILFFMLTGIVDMIDGKIAGLFKRDNFKKIFGRQIDTVLDVFNFVAIPAFILYNFGFNNTIDFIFLVLYTGAATMRLAYFNTMCEIDNNCNVYYGLPVTTIALILPLILLIESILNSFVSRVLLLIISFLYVSKFKIIKPTSYSFYIIMGIVGIIIYISFIILI